MYDSGDRQANRGCHTWNRTTFHYRRIAYTDIESTRLLSTDATSEGEALTVIINGCKVAINNHAGRDVIYHTISALRKLWSVICPEYRKSIWLQEGLIWENPLTDSWQSSVTISRCIRSPMRSFCSVDAKEYDESPLFWPGWICTPAEAPGQWKIPMATQCFRSQTSDKAGIPLADGRTFHWPAESDTACERQGLLICAICRFWKIFYSRSRLLTEDIHRCEIMGCVVRG